MYTGFPLSMYKYLQGVILPSIALSSNGHIPIALKKKKKMFTNVSAFFNPLTIQFAKSSFFAPTPV